MTSRRTHTIQRVHTTSSSWHMRAHTCGLSQSHVVVSLLSYSLDNNTPNYSLLFYSVDLTPNYSLLSYSVDLTPNYSLLSYSVDLTPKYSLLSYSVDLTPNCSLLFYSVNNTPSYTVLLYSLGYSLVQRCVHSSTVSCVSVLPCKPSLSPQSTISRYSSLKWRQSCWWQ